MNEPKNTELEAKIKAYPHLEQVGARCGKVRCEFYGVHNKSGCSKFDDRRLCSKSIKTLRKNKNRSKKRSGIINWSGC
jgi:hypothetical protein